MLGAMLALWTATYVGLGAIRHNRFGTFGFDLGIYDQAVWLVSKFRDPFITVRGLDFFGHHFNPFLILFAPFYWLGAGPRFLLIVQVLAQAGAGLGVYLLARDRLHSRWLGVAITGVLLLNPTNQWLVWEFFHPDVLAVPGLIFAYWAARQGRWGMMWLSAFVTLAMKEDAALAIMMLGILLAVWGERRRGALLAGIGLSWFVLVTRVLLPEVNGVAPFYDSFFSDFGGSPWEVIKNAVSHPTETFRYLTQDDHLTWYFKILIPFAFIPLRAWWALSLALPMIAVNALASFPYTRDFRFHYSAIVLAAAVIACIEAIARFRPSSRRWVVGAAALAALGSSLFLGPGPLSLDFANGQWPFGGRARAAAEIRQQALALVPGGASVSASYSLVPHLAHRPEVYEFPVPWRNVNWGIAGENLADPGGVEWLVLDRGRIDQNDADLTALIDQLLTTQFTVRFDQDGVAVAERIAPG